MIIQNSKGDIFDGLLRCDEKTIENNYKPLTHSLIVTKFDNKFLLVYDKWKQIWELPGGGIEGNESPRNCAIRELQEEANQVSDKIEFSGIMKLILMPDKRIEYGSLYACELNKVSEFVENEEIKEIMFWDRKSNITIDEIDREILNLL